MSRLRRFFELSCVFVVLFTSSFVLGNFLNLSEGSTCLNSGICTKMPACATTNFNDLVICNYSGYLPIVCCQPAVSDRIQTVTNQKQTVSEKMCKKYSQYVFTPPRAIKRKRKDGCAKAIEILIYGGEEAKIGEFPHMVQIGYGTRKPTSRDAWLCGGSLISERFVLSAAHCSNLKLKAATLHVVQYGGLARWARMGIVDTDKAESDGLVLEIVDRITRADSSKSKYDDIVLFKLKRNVVFSPNLRPICLQVNEHIDQTSATAVGWGKLDDASRSPNTNLLQYVQLQLVDNDECNDKLGHFYSKGIKDTQICAGVEEGKDACMGDSGGPLQIPLEEPYCMYSLIGITSGGGRCGRGDPGVYTRVSKYTSWIEENVWPNEKPED